MFVKICGITSLEDAWTAVEAGADALGFIFHPASPRFVLPEAASVIVTAIRREAPSVRCVGVFVNEPVERIRSLLDSIPLDWAQLHGDEPPEALAALGDRAYKVLRPRPGIILDPEPYRGRLVRGPALGVDAWHRSSYGGSGQPADWEIAAAWAKKYPLLLAGGLTPENVARAITYVRPWGVDVSSGVETAPGRKDPARVRAFIAEARRAFAEQKVSADGGRTC